MALNFEDVEFIKKYIVIPYTKRLTDIVENDTSFEYYNKMLIMIAERINELEISNLKNISFIKAVLFENKLSNEECYKNYIEEWDKLNKEYIDTKIKE